MAQRNDRVPGTQGQAQVKADDTSVAPKWRVNLTLVVCFLECLIFGGTVFGWAVLAFVFKADGVYAHACNETYIDSPAKRTSSYPFLPLPNKTNIQYHTGVNNVSAVPGGNDVNGTQGRYDVTSHQAAILDCADQDSHYSLAYTLTIAFMGIFAFPVGWLFDHFGIMVTRIAATFLCVPALVMLATCDGDMSWMLYPALPMLGIANIMILVTNNHVCTMAGNRTSTMIALYSGAVASSGIVSILIKLAHDAAISRFTSLLTVAVCWSLVGVSTFGLLPRFKVIPKSPNQIPKTAMLEVSNKGELPKEEVTFLTKADEACQMSSDTNGELTSSNVKDSLCVRNSSEPKERGELWKTVCSLYLLSHAIWFSLLHLRLQSFVGSFVTWSSILLSGDRKQVAMACDVFGYTQLICIVISPIIGIFMDRKRRYLTAHQITGRRRAVATVPSLLLGSSFSSLLSACVLIPAPWVALVAPPVSHFARSFLYSSAFASLDFIFPKEHFGKLIGIMYFVGGSISFLQQAFFMWAETSGFLQANIGLLVVSLITFAHPVAIWVQHIRHSRRG